MKHEAKFINEKGVMVTKEFASPFYLRRFVNKAKRSKRVTLISHTPLE